TFGRIELQGPGQVLQERSGNADLAALLEPGVPGQPDPGQRGHLFAPKPGGTPAPARGEPDLLGRDALAPTAQEVGQLRPVSLETAWRAHPVTSSNSINGQIVTPSKRY